MNDPLQTDSENVITFKSNEEATQESIDQQLIDEYETADERLEPESPSDICNRSYSHADIQNDSNDRAIGQIAEMFSGMSSLFKDVIKELRELKQPQQMTGLSGVARCEGYNEDVNYQASRPFSQHRHLSPNAESFEPRSCEVEISDRGNRQPSHDKGGQSSNAYPEN